jgi:DNA repair exonuclease SbcCD nuclease subunit
MVRILHCSDIHLDTSFSGIGLPAAIGTRLRAELQSTLGNILSEARRLDVDAVSIGGDLFDQSTAVPETARFLVQQFERMGKIKVLIAPGESDPYGSNSLYALTRWPQNVYVFAATEFQPFPLFDAVTIWGAACPSASPDAWKHQIHVDSQSLHILLAHGVAETERTHSLFSVDEKDLELLGIRLALLGGRHIPDNPGDGARLIFPGSPQPLSWSDQTRARGAVLISMDDGNISTHRIDLKAWSFKEFAVDLGECSSISEAAQRVEQSISKHEVLDLQTAVFHVVLCGQPATRLPLSQIQNALDPDINAVLRREFSPNFDLESLAQEQTVRGLLVRRTLDSMAHTADDDGKNELMASLNIALLTLEGKRVDV